MAAHSALVPRFDRAARWRAGLLTFVVIAAAGNSAWASGAQAWAEHLRDSMKCGLMHSETRDGENLAGGKKLDAEGAVRMWAGERDKYRYSPRYEFEPRSGHYTQIVWRKTTHIGCARVTCGRNAVVVCRYRPAGNRIGKAPY